MRVDMAALKKDVMEGVLEIKRCTGSRQVVDVLIQKRVNSDLIKKVLTDGSLKGVVESIL